jgi:hypothetical protein
MPTFDEFRIKFPSLKKASDEEIIERTSKIFNLPVGEVMDVFGYQLNEPGLLSDTKRTVGQIVGSAGSTLRDIGAPNVGKSIERYGQDVAFKNPSEINSFSDVLSNPGTTAREAIGELAPQIGTSLTLAATGGAIGQGIGTLVGAPAGPGGAIAGRVIGGYVGAKGGQFLGNLVQEYGGIRQEQREAGIEDKPRALVGAGGAALIDTAFGIEGAINKIAARKGLNILTRGAGEGAIKYAGKQTALGFGVEALTEGAQTGIERWAAHKDLLSNEALNEYGVSAVKGGIGGGTVRGGLSLFANKAPGETDPSGGNKKDEIGQAFQQKDATQPDPSTATPATATRDPAARLAELEAISKGVPAREHITPDGEIVKIPGQEGRYFTPAEQTEYRTLKGLASPQAAQPPALSAGVMSGLTGGGGDPLAGRSNLVGGGPAPAVTGGSTDIAVAQQQAQAQNQQAQVQQRQAQAAQVASQQFGIVNPNTPAIGNVFGQKVYGPNIQAAAGAVANFTTQMQPHQLQMAQAITQANNATGNKLIKYQFNANDVVASVQKGLQAVQKVANQFQIGHTQSAEEAAAILNDQSEQLQGDKLEQLNAVFYALTGQNTTGYEASQLSTLAKGAKNVQQPKLQTTTGLGEVPVQGTASQTVDGGGGNVRPAEIQPIGTGSLGAGSLGLQVGQPPAEGIRTSTGSNAAVDVRGNPPQNAQVGGQNVEATNGAAGQQQTVVSSAAQVAPKRLTNEYPRAVSPELQTQSIEEQQAQEVPNLIRSALRMIYGSDRKVELLLHLTEKTNRSNYAKLAKDYGVTEQYVKELASDAITDEGETHPRFIVKNIDKFLSAVNHQAEIMNVSLLEALDGLEVINEVYGQNNNQLLGTQVNEEDIVASGLAIQNREERVDKNGKKIGKSDLTNVTNIVDEEDYRDRASEAYLSEMDRYEADPSEANQARLDAAAEAASAKNQTQAKKLYQKYQVLTGVRNAVQKQSADEGDVREPAGGGEEVGEANAKPKKPTRARKAKTETKPAEEAKQEVATVEAKPEEVKTPEEQWSALAEQFPMMPPYESLDKDEKIRWDDVASRGVANLAAANKVLTTTVKAGTPQTQGATRTTQAITDESMIVDGTGLVREITPEQRQLLEGPAKQLTDGQTARLEKHYGAKRGTAEFFTKLQEDVSRYATKGAEAVNAAVRDIIKAVYTSLLATAVVFNPTYMNQAEAYVYHAPQAYSITKEVRAEAPAAAASKMSDAAKEAYATLVPALKADLVKRNKLFIMADKPSARIFVFAPDGKLILEKKSLFGLAKGDFYKGNNDLPTNRITPAGLHNIIMVDAAKGGSAAVTAGEYDFGKVFGIVDKNPGVLTMMHSVWLKETDAAKRAAALKNESAADSRYSFGCINVDKDTYKSLLEEHGEQMDGAKLFIVPDNQARIKEFVSGKVAQNLTGEDVLIRQAVEPVTETTTGVRQNAQQTANIDRTQVGKEEEVRLANQEKPSTSKTKFGKDNRAANPYTAAELTKEIEDFIRTPVVSRKLTIVDSVEDLLKSSNKAVQKLGAILAVEGAYGVAVDGKAYLIANRIEKGRGRAKFMHEVGAHLGLENLLPTASYNRLVNQIEKWAASDADTNEVTIANRALLRVENANTPQEDRKAELLAYFIEEAVQAGIDPTATVKQSGALREWFRTLWSAFKTAVRKLGLNPEAMTAQDVVDMAFGAARLEMAGSWHGTAAQFRSFNHKYMGAGEGAQAYGWGTYLAERVGIAKEYWKADVRRKVDVDPTKGNPVTRFLGLSPLTKPEGSLLRVDTSITPEEMLDWDARLSEQPAVLAKAKKLPKAVKEALLDETNLDVTEMTGEDLYRGLQNIELKTGLISEQFEVADYNKRLSRAKAKEVVSKYLDEKIGLPGLKFYDARSRSSESSAVSINGAAYTHRQLTDPKYKTEEISDNLFSLFSVIRNGVEATKKELETDIAEGIERQIKIVTEIKQQYKTPVNEAEIRAQAEADAKDGHRYKKLQWLNDNDIRVVKTQNEQTRNLVVFNDKNLYRVGGETAADRQRMRFGKERQQGAFSRAGEWLDSAVTNPKGLARKIKLGFLTLEQLSDMDPSPNQVVRSYTDISNYMMMASKELVNRAVKIDTLWAKLTPAMDAKLSQVMRDATRLGFDPAFMGARNQKTNEAQEQLLEDYSQLNPEAQNIYLQVRQHYQDLFEKRKTILESTAAKLGGKELKEVQEMYSKLTGPYFPLGRVGDYYAVGMSPRVLELTDKEEASGLTAAEKTELKGLRARADQYKSSSFKTLKEARKAAAQMKAELGTSYFNEVATRMIEGTAGLPNFAKLEDYITSQLGGETRAEVQNMLSQMMFDMLPEHHALKSAMRREGIHGENENMRQVFAKSSLSQAHYISRLQYGEQLNEALQKVAKTARRDHDMRTIENELKLRTKISMVDSQSPLTDLALNASYFAHLGLSPAFLITNMTQVPMITAPWLYARHGLNNSRMAMAQAIVDSAKIIKSTYTDGDWRSEINWNEQFPVGSREDRMFRTLSDRSALDITVEHDLAAVASANRGFFDDKISKATNGSLGGLSDVVKLVNTPVRVTELANRASTALAAYRLKWEALASAGLNDEDRHRVATDYAGRAVSETQLNYSELNAPRYMRSLFGSKPLARLVFQFRKYQQGMLYLVTKNIADAFAGATKEEKRIARRTIGGLYATTFLMAGTTGMPLMGTVGLAGISNLIAGMFGDDDEPWDFETEYRNFLTDWLGHDMALLVAKGIPAYLGVDLSQRVGLSEIANPIPYVQRGSTGQSMVANTIYAGLGAPAGLLGSAADGIMQMANGDIIKGIEHIVPLKEAKDMLRAYRFSTEGLTDRRGNVVLPPESFSAWDIAFRGMGFTPTKESEYYAANEAMHTAEQAAKDVKNNLLRRYAEARMNDKDTDAIQDKIDAYNDRHPEKGVRITVSAMLKAVQQRRKMAEERTGSGVRIGKAQRPFADEARFAEDDEEE